MSIANYLTVAEAAAVIGVTPGRVRQLVVADEIKGVERVGKRALLIPKREAERIKNIEPTVGRPRSNRP